MRKKDLEIKATIGNMLENNFSGRRLKIYFEALPDKSIRRAIGILSDIYPDKTTISDDDFAFIPYMFSDARFTKQDSFPGFVRAVNILNFTEHQKKLLTDAIKNDIEGLCDKCTYELDALLVHLFEPNDLIQYLSSLADEGSPPVLQRISDILQYEDFSNSSVSVEVIEALKQKVSKLLLG